MGLFDRLFGKIEEPKIEDVVKEALENLDLTDDSDASETIETEVTRVEDSDAADLMNATSSESVEDFSEAEVQEESIIEPVQVEEIPQEETIQVEEVSPIESYEEEIVQPQSDEAETEFFEEEEANQAIEEAPQVQETEQEKYDRSLKKTRTGFGARLNAFFANFRSVDEDFFEELEELLIMSDVGVQVASNLTEELRYEAKLENAKKPDALRRVIIEKLVELYEKDGIYNETINFQDGLTVMLFVGVNGVGKTTSIGKLANR